MNDATRYFRQVQAVFDEVIALPEDRRGVRLQELCGSDERLREDVASLLSALAEEFAASGSAREQAHPSREGLPQRKIGPYQIESLLGRGGMGAVYLAHRADGAYDKKVAIKLIDLPLATNLFRERFRNERQILAGLEHPSIARMLDGGVSDGGDPYLVMEYVQGEPIDTFCTRRALTLPERLRLFQSVCDAVQFAHQNLVVHRDLKPDNILVDNEGRPHLLDFGTAKILSSSGPDAKSAFTREGFLSFTPQYASPEQVLGKPITTASDTYSLGVLLYLLLSGTLPYELREFSTEEMYRLICEQPPRRIAAAPEFKAPLGGDLEAIVEKALRKEPEQRYVTTEQMRLDVQAFLDDRPVSARQGTIRYKATKLIRRNRLSFSIAALLILSLIGGAIAIAWQARIANRARHLAEARSTDLRQLSNSLLSELYDAIQQIPGSTSAQQLLVTRVLEHLDRMTADSAGDKIAQLDLADAYTKLGKLQGDAYEQNLGDKPGAIKSLDKAVAIAEPLARANPGDVAALTTLARAQDARGEVLSQTGDNQGAAGSLRAAIAAYTVLIGLPGVTPALLFEAADVYDILGDLLAQDTGFGDAAGGLENYRKTIDMNHRALQMDPSFMRVRRGLVTMQMKLGNIQLEMDPQNALLNFRAALEAYDALPKDQQERLNMLRLHALLLRKQADALSELGRYDEAAQNFARAFREYKHLASADPKDNRAIEDVYRELHDEAISYENASDPKLVSSPAARQQSLHAAERALEDEEAAVRRLLEVDPKESRYKASLDATQVHLGTVRFRSRQAYSEQQVRSALAELRKDAAHDDASSMILELVVSAYLQVEPSSLGDTAYALSQARRGVALTHRKSAVWLLWLAQACLANGKSAEAVSAAREGIALLPPAEGAAGNARLRRLLQAIASREPS